jgi:hypothetical protein
MKKMVHVIFAATLAVALISIAAAQDSKALPPSHLYGAGASVKLPTVIHRSTKPPTTPFFCQKSNCLIYNGDNDTTSPNANGLFGMENAGIGITDAEVVVNYKTGPKKSGYTATGMSANFYTNATAIGTNPTPVQFRTGVSSGNAGKQICTGTTGGTAVMAAYGEPDFGLNSDNYWIKKLNKPCKVPPKKIIFWFIVPQYNDSSTVGYLEDDDGARANKFATKGFSEKPDNSFFNSSTFGDNFVNTSGSSGACGGVGCTGFSAAVNGH